MDNKMCTICNIEKHTNNFYKKYTACIDCNRARGLKRYYENKDKVSKQQKIYYEKNREKIFLQKQNNRIIQFRDLVISYIELENRLKILEEKLKECISTINLIKIVLKLYSNCTQNCTHIRVCIFSIHTYIRL